VVVEVVWPELLGAVWPELFGVVWLELVDAELFPVRVTCTGTWWLLV
jgi:hypothetical protein